MKPIDTKVEKYANLLEAWDANNSKIITWLKNYMIHSIGYQSVEHENVNDVCDNLTRL